MNVDGRGESNAVDKFQDSKSLLQRITEQAREHAEKKPRGFRYNDEVLLRFAMNSWIMGGRQFYEVLYENLDAFPSPRTVQARIADYDDTVPEGQVNVKKLKDYLVKHQLPFIVTLAEDATSIVGKREYHCKTNRIFGFSLPLRENGITKFTL